MKTTRSKSIKDYKENTRILYCHKCHQTLQWEAIISEFSDTGEYVCLENSHNKTNDWYEVTDIIVLDTLKNKHSKNIEEFIKKEREQFTREEALFQKYDKMSYEQQEADAIEKECEEYEITKDKMIFFDEVDQKMTEEGYNEFGEYILSPKNLELQKKWREKKAKFDEDFAKIGIRRDPMWQKPLSTSNPIPNTTSP
jgi:hypothetical protein